MDHHSTCLSFVFQGGDGPGKGFEGRIRPLE